MKETIRFNYEIYAGPIWPPEDDKLYDLLTSDEKLMDLNITIQILYSSYYNLIDNLFSYEMFSDEYFSMDKSIHADLFKKLIKRLNEINDGSFIIPKVADLNFDKLEYPHKNGFVYGKRRVIIKLDYHINPISTLDDFGRRALKNLPIIENDKKLNDLSHQLQEIFESCFVIDPHSMTFDHDRDLFDEKKPKMDILIKQIRHRLDEINDGSFTVDPHYFRNFLFNQQNDLVSITINKVIL